MAAIVGAVCRPFKRSRSPTPGRGRRCHRPGQVDGDVAGLDPVGQLGIGLGAFVLTSIDGDLLKPFITTYLAIMGVVIIWRATRQTRERIFPRKFAGPLGLVGGFFDAIGGGGWGPTVTTTLVGTGQNPRISIGTTNTAEFFVTSAISATFLAALLTSHWDQAEGFASHATAILGLILGWAVLVGSLSPLIGQLPMWGQVPVYIFLGLIWIWILPLRRLLAWMETGRWHQG